MSWRIPLSRPQINDSDRAAVLGVLNTSVLSLGEQLAGFEREFGEFFGGAHAVGVSSGTAGLYLALQALGVDGGEVLTPSYGFVGTIHAIRLAGAEPRFVEVDPDTLCVTVETLERAYTSECRAVLPVHIFGTPCPMKSIVEWARARQVPVIEDAAEAVGAEVDGRPAGTWGDAGVLAFYPNKQMTTGEGGLVVSRSETVSREVASLRNQGRGEGEFEFSRPGFNFRLDEMSSALGRSQLARLPEILAAREERADAYRERLRDVSGLALLPPVPPPNSRSWFVFPVFVADPAHRGPVREALASAGIQTAPYFPAIHSMPIYSQPSYQPTCLRFTEEVARRSFAIPFFADLTIEELEDVSSCLRASLAELGADLGEFDLQTLRSAPRTLG